MQQDGNQEWQQPNTQPAEVPYQPVTPQDIPSYDQNIEEPAQSESQVDEAPDDGAVLRWQGPEYVEHDRGVKWYIVFVIVAITLMAAAIFLIKSITFTILIPVMALALFVYTRRPAQYINYTVGRKGIHVNDKLYPYADFKAFAVNTRDGASSIIVIPRKRFQMALIAYFPEEVGEALVDMLAARLPMQTYAPDFMDKLLTKLRI
jgi:hypothetical protein